MLIQIYAAKQNFNVISVTSKQKLIELSIVYMLNWGLLTLTHRGAINSPFGFQDISDACLACIDP